MQLCGVDVTKNTNKGDPQFSTADVRDGNCRLDAHRQTTD